MTDAKCEKDRIVLGGWLLNERGNPTCAPWFPLSLGVGETPWLFRGDGESSWANTSAELLASLVALKVLPLEAFRSGAVRSHLLHCGGGTQQSRWFFVCSKSEYKVAGHGGVDGIFVSV